MAAFWLRNLIAYSLQIAILAVACGVVLHALRIRIAKIRLFCWQALLASCLLVPAIQPRLPWMDDSEVQISTSHPTFQAPARPRGFWLFPSASTILILLGTGIAIRFALLGVGLLRIRRYRLNSKSLPGAFRDLQQKMGVFADIRLSKETSGPVTFGFLRPAVLLPQAALEDESVACHELAHVRRHDWLFTVIEEGVLSVFWFHPAVWWLVSEIQLAREQAVDQEVVEILKSRDRYLESLLRLAAAKAGMDLALASPFLRKRHLQKRVAALLKEVSMSKLRLNSSLAMFIAALTIAGWLGMRSFPLQAAPQDGVANPGVEVQQNGLTLLHSSPIRYPQEAIDKGIQGPVVLELTLSRTGTVSDAAVLSGPDELRKAALESVLEWHYASDGQALPAKTQVTLMFKLPEKNAASGLAATALQPPSPSMATVQGVDLQLPEPLKTKVAGSLSVHAGDQLTRTSMRDLEAAVKAVDEHLRLGLRASPDGSGSIVVVSLANSPAATPQRIRVGGNVQQANLIEKVTPKYPPDAKQARIQGKVSFTVTIGKDGKVENVDLISGHPLLADAAKEAVLQWVYKPTLLNGQPIEVLTQVDVNFTLLQ